MEGTPKRTPWTPGEILAACVHEIAKKKNKKNNPKTLCLEQSKRTVLADEVTK